MCGIVLGLGGWQNYVYVVCLFLTHPNVSHYTYALENRDQKSPRGPQKIHTNNYNYSTSKQTNNYNYSPSKQKYKQIITTIPPLNKNTNQLPPNYLLYFVGINCLRYLDFSFRDIFGTLPGPVLEAFGA